jgi:RND family efflux transporter MFP subunit
MNQLEKLRIDRGEDEESRRSSRGILKKVLILLLLCGMTGLGFALYTGPLHPAPKVQVTTVTVVNPSQANSVLNASGYVVAQRKAEVASKATGRLVELNVEEGSVVKKGQVIARLESRDVEAALAQAEAQLEQAKATRAQAEADFARKKKLLEERFVSRSDYDLAQANFQGAVAGVKAAEAQVNAAEVNLENTYVRAPFNGTVLTKNADVGEIVAPFGSAGNSKGTVVSMADMDSLQVEADVSESNIERVSVGQPCEITLDAFPEKRYRGAVHMIVPTADRAKATVMTKIRFLDRDERVLPEMSAKVVFLSKELPAAEEQAAPRLTVDPKAVMNRNGREIVFVIRDGRVVETPVTLGQPMGSLVEVRRGPVAGDQVVLNPPAGLASGDRVRIIE